MSERETIEALLGTSLGDLRHRLHVASPDGDLDVTVAYASLEIGRAQAVELVARAGLTSPEAARFAAVLLPGGWSVEPADPPPWWPADPSVLDEQAARPLDANGWLVCGYGDGHLWMLATWTPGS